MILFKRFGDDPSQVEDMPLSPQTWAKFDIVVCQNDV